MFSKVSIACIRPKLEYAVPVLLPQLKPEVRELKYREQLASEKLRMLE